MTSSVDPAMATLLEAAELFDEDEEPVVSKEIIGEISSDRLAVWSSRLVDLDTTNSMNKYFAVRCEGGRGLLEHAVCIRNGRATPLMIECKVSYEELPPSALVEYRFDDDAAGSGGGQWRLSMVSLDYLLAFRAGKFKDWEKRMLQPTCKAEFRRMFKAGPVFSIYDHPMFPSPPEEFEQFQVKDDRTGRKLVLPRPVSALRIWSTEKQTYVDVDPTLDGAPVSDADREAYWNQLILKMKENFGEEEFEEMLHGTVEE